MMLFISYSSQDRTSLDALTAALRRSQQQVWFDQELGGGDSWWNKILERMKVGFDYRYSAWTTGQRFNTYSLLVTYAY